MLLSDFIIKVRFCFLYYFKVASYRIIAFSLFSLAFFCLRLLVRIGRAVDRGIQINRGISIFLSFLSSVACGAVDFSFQLLLRKVALMSLSTNFCDHVSVHRFANENYVAKLYRSQIYT